MTNWLKLVASVVKFFTALAQWFATEQAKADGAALQRAKDLEADHERLSKATAAADAVRDDGGVPVDKDPLNRANNRKR